MRTELYVPIEYHTRRIDGQRLSWEVSRLRALSSELAPAEIPLDSIFEFDQVYWFDAEYLPTCRSVVDHARRIQAADLSDPILLSHDGYVIDGMHRVARAFLDGLAGIRAVRLSEYPDPDRLYPVGGENVTGASTG